MPDQQMDTTTALSLAVAITKAATLPREEPTEGDLVVEVTGFNVDPDAIGWLLGHGDAPYDENDPLDGSVPMRTVWDIRPLNPDAKCQTVGGVELQRWENARFVKVPDWIVERLGLCDDRNEQTYEYRAVASDKGDLAGDMSGPFATERLALQELVRMLDAEPPYDEGWIERRVCTDWERVDV